VSSASIKQYDVIVVGAGLIGSALALLLAQIERAKPLNIAVVERAEPLKEASQYNQRVVALGEVARSVLNQVGVFDQLGFEHCHAYQRMFVWDENSNGELEFTAQDAGTEALGHMIDSQQCNYLLQQKMLQHNNVDSFYAAKPFALNLEANRTGLIIENSDDTDAGEQALTAPLIIAADGGRSWVRQQARIFVNHQSYDQYGIVANVKSSKPHQDTAWQRFLHTGPVAVLPLADNHSSIVWSADNQEAESLMSLSDAGFCQALSQALEGRLGDFELCTKRQSFSLQSQRAERYFAKSAVLVGDAAHSIHPLAGQGANLGFKDIVHLTQLLKDELPSNFANPVLLQRFQRVRKADNEQTDTMMSALHKAYQGEAGLWLAMRGLGMNFINRSDTLKRVLARQAIGT